MLHLVMVLGSYGAPYIPTRKWWRNMTLNYLVCVYVSACVRACVYVCICTFIYLFCFLNGPIKWYEPREENENVTRVYRPLRRQRHIKTGRWRRRWQAVVREEAPGSLRACWFKNARTKFVPTAMIGRRECGLENERLIRAVCVF